jgi:hypothetical protein
MSTTTSGSTSDGPEIRIGVRGRITAGRDAGASVFIQDVASSTGGFLVLVGQDLTEPVGYDDWVKDLNDLKDYFTQVGWRVEWDAGD